MHKFGPTICACGPRIIAGMHISQICINKAPFGNNMVRSLLRALLKSLQKSLQTNDMNIGGPRGPCSYRPYLHRYRNFDHAIGRSVQLLAGNNWVLQPKPLIEPSRRSCHLFDLPAAAGTPPGLSSGSQPYWGGVKNWTLLSR